MSLLNKIGDTYHKRAYTPIANLTSKLTDSTDYCITDIALWAVPFTWEICGLAVLEFVYNINKFGLEESSGLTLSPIFTIAGVVATTYGLNILRTPLEQKLCIT